jgi:hypothetical protein
MGAGGVFTRQVANIHSQSIVAWIFTPSNFDDGVVRRIRDDRVSMHQCFGATAGSMPQHRDGSC